MENNIKEVLHLYVGSEARISFSDESKYYTATINGSMLKRIEDFEDEVHVVPILRRLSSMSEEEATDFLIITGFVAPNDVRFIDEGDVFPELEFNHYRGDKEFPGRLVLNYFTAEQVAWLLKAGFWLFSPDAWEKGLIIDKDAVKTN